MGLFLYLPISFFAQTSSFQTYCDEAYAANPEVPKGLLEAVSFVQTRMTHLDASVQESCTGMPRAWGYMGLIADGEGYFNNTLSLVSAKSGIPVSTILAEPAMEIKAYAAAYTAIRNEYEGIVYSKISPLFIKSFLLKLSFIPDSGAVNDFARNSEVYEIFKFLNNPEYQAQYGFPHYNFDLRSLFGSANYAVLSSSKVVFTETAISTPGGITYQPKVSVTKSTQYGPAIFNPAATCNFSSRNGIAVSAITIHTIQGTYAGAISWAQNCSSSVSYHFVIRSSDGQITQMVLEQDKAWHVGSENPYTIGYEHEGYVTQPQWYTEAMYTASADLSRDIVNSGYGIPAVRTYYGDASATTQTLGGCTKIKGHQHYPNQSHTDPGINWNWEKYYRLINNNPTITTLTSGSGSFYDSGGAAGSYADDERLIWVISPPNVSSVSINFTQFSVEQGYDKLFIYDGNSIDANLIGVYTGTTSPGTITASGGALTLEFRSDCATTGTGWAANWTSTSLDTEPPSSVVEAISDYQTTNYTVHFTDSDIGAGVAKQYARVSDKVNGAADWHGNSDYGYLDESFDLEATAWSEVTGDWNQANQSYEMTDIAQSNSNAAIPVMQDSLHEYLYHWKQTITSAGVNQRAGAHFFCDNTALPNRGNSYFVYLREGTNVAQIYEVINDTWTLQAEDTVVVAENVSYDMKVTYDPEGGSIQVYVDNAFIVEWIDPNPLKTANGFSLRSGGCGVRYDEVSVYQSRYNQLDLSIGVDSMIRYQSDNGASAAKVATLLVDFLGNWSTIANEEYRIDWTSTELISLNDGISGADIDTIYVPVVSANWNFADLHSGINHYSFAVGTSATTQDILPWTNAGMVNSINHVLQNPVLGTTYFVQVRAENEAGLLSEFVSDGQLLLEEPPSTAGLSENEIHVSIYPQPASHLLHVVGNWNTATVQLVDLTGRLVGTTSINGKEGSIPLHGLASGYYQLIIASNVGSYSQRILIHQEN
ncbi:MAG: N-acetylmuramoyl-L-alanine amidase [Fluviicola sp.]|nr:N-acetylmuramoyl-L-alanine amidase [Fluviicola sp.]